MSHTIPIRFSALLPTYFFARDKEPLPTNAVLRLATQSIVRGQRIYQRGGGTVCLTITIVKQLFTQHTSLCPTMNPRQQMPSCLGPHSDSFVGSGNSNMASGPYVTQFPLLSSPSPNILLCAQQRNLPNKCPLTSFSLNILHVHAATNPP